MSATERKIKKEIDDTLATCGTFGILNVPPKSNDDFIVALSEALENNTKVRFLSFSENYIGTKGLLAVSQLLRKNTFLKILDFSKCELSGEETVIFCNTFPMNSSIEKLNFKDNQIRDEGTLAICGTLRTSRTVTELNLSNNNIGVASAKYLAEILKTNITLKKLDLSGNQLGDEGVIILMTGLEKNVTLTELNLSGNKIGDDGAIAIGRSINSCGLLKLDLTKNEIAEQGGFAVLDSLKENSTLTSFKLKDNQPGWYYKDNVLDRFFDNYTLVDIDMESFGLARRNSSHNHIKVLIQQFEQSIMLPSYTKNVLALSVPDKESKDSRESIEQEFNRLRSTFDLINNEIKDRFELATAHFDRSLWKELKELKKLKQLLRSAFIVYMTGIMKLVDKISAPELTITHLVHAYVNDINSKLPDIIGLNRNFQLDFEFSGIGDKGVRIVGDLIERCMYKFKLKHISLKRNIIGDKGAKIIADSLKMSYWIEVLDLSHNKIGDEGARALIEALKVNYSLTELRLFGNNISPALMDTIKEMVQQNLEFHQMLDYYSPEVCDARITPSKMEVLRKQTKKDKYLKDECLHNTLQERLGNLEKSGCVKSKTDRFKAIASFEYLYWVDRLSCAKRKENPELFEISLEEKLGILNALRGIIEPYSGFHSELEAVIEKIDNTRSLNEKLLELIFYFNETKLIKPTSAARRYKKDRATGEYVERIDKEMMEEINWQRSELIHKISSLMVESGHREILNLYFEFTDDKISDLITKNDNCISKIEKILDDKQFSGWCDFSSMQRDTRYPYMRDPREGVKSNLKTLNHWLPSYESRERKVEKESDTLIEEHLSIIKKAYVSIEEREKNVEKECIIISKQHLATIAEVYGSMKPSEIESLFMAINNNRHTDSLYVKLIKAVPGLDSIEVLKNDDRFYRLYTTVKLKESHIVPDTSIIDVIKTAGPRFSYLRN